MRRVSPARAIENVPGVSYVSPNAFTAATLKVRHEEVPGLIVGTTPAVVAVREPMG